jgi:glycosyltransferase involved in cell wall biosynthesis
MATAAPSRAEPSGAAERRRPRLLIFIVAYNAERTIEDVLQRIPAALTDDYEVEVLIIDDASQDRTFERGEQARASAQLPFELQVLYNPVNQGYGGNQKIGFHFAIERGFDYVALLHGDAQYAPESLPELVDPLARGEADAVLGSRMLGGGALAGGMPLYKFVGNKLLTAMQNRLLRAQLSEFHSGYRVYSVAALRRIPFDLNTNDFHFDTEIIIQLLLAEQRIVEVPIPTYYGDELCHVDGVAYAWNVTKTTAKARAQELSLFYDRKFDCRPDEPNAHYVAKLDYASPHTFALQVVRPGSRVLDLGCAGGFLGAELRRRGCRVTGVDVYPLAPGVELDEFHLHDLNDPGLPVDPAGYDYVLLLDVLEHLDRPEEFLERLRDATASAPDISLVVSTGNVAFALTRLMLLAGQFNYGKRGILDLTHTRLFTFATIGRLLESAGFEPTLVRGVPAPMPLAVGSPKLSRALLRTNRALLRLRKSLFAYQVFMVARPRPSLDRLLADAERGRSSSSRAGRSRSGPAT